jgi:murein DD-endopeptidase MepM/ murein hydrolase activator NlpD
MNKLKLFIYIFSIFSILVLGLWFFEYAKNTNNDIEIYKATTTTKVKKLLKHELYTTPVSYILGDERSILIDLTNMNLFLIKKGDIIKTIKVLHKGPNNLWFQSPTNYFNVGVKYKLLRSGIVDVYMPYSVQIHQDFFVHGIPYLPNGERVTSRYSGGCLRVSDEDAKEIYDFTQLWDKIIVYEKSIDNDILKPNFYNPIDSNRYWIRQDFNSPLKINGQYLQHAAVDMSTKEPENVRAIYDGKVEDIIIMGNKDYGFGNTVILKHTIDNKIVYSLYAHLESIDFDLKTGQDIKGGDILGITGASGYGCQNYWRLGKDGCDQNSSLDRHLHLEIKTKPILTNPEGENDCLQKNGDLGPCFGYVPKDPLKYGYINPIKFIILNNE